ncbi:hypothetical protein SAMN02745216_03303 [Desulfatibacillum alkenivorans DSM 16219]|jgi:hypothetical protein|uniref:Uncharacterized protein n=1 Tax=Desulfatibacillum alkenivorans DSM 16219 TaxID=1121393 RepID=A0A1M6RN51_9BACT|nr:hypothetical protein SAMN02745216_03303 [Desulfatibacillum alkenivorans DSM 16219]
MPKIEAGREIRIDCTVVESNIHPPTDSTLLWDAVRVLTRLLTMARDLGVPGLCFQSHTRRAKQWNSDPKNPEAIHQPFPSPIPWLLN